MGLIAKEHTLHYMGIDVNKRAIEWCKKYIAENNQEFRYLHRDLFDARYNPNGKKHFFPLE